MNINLLIVDDEDLDREGLLNEIDWQQYGITEIKVARTGIEAIKIMEEYKVNILITDINMPVLNGIKLAEHAKKKDQFTKIIFISGYDNFEYAKDAIKLDASGYILKPVDTDELIEVIIKVVDDIVQEQKKLDERNKYGNFFNFSKEAIKTGMFNNLFFGIYNDENEFISRASYIDLNIVKGKYCIAIVELDNHKNTEISEKEIKQALYASFNSTFFEILRNGFYGEFVFTSINKCTILFSFREEIPDVVAKEELFSACNKIIEYMENSLNIIITISISNIFNSLNQAKQAFADANNTLAMKEYLSGGRVLHKDYYNNKVDFSLSFQNIDEELSKLLIIGDKQRIIDILDNMFNIFENCNDINKNFVKNICINIISRINITMMEMGMNINELFDEETALINKLMRFETIVDIRTWMKNIFFFILEFKLKKESEICYDLKQEVKNYIEKNYNRDISLKEIAHVFHYSPNYFGELFKQNFGKNFSEYLAEYRMKKAASILQKSDLKIYEIAYIVGYNNISAFIKKFKQVFNVTPAEYRISNKS